MKRNKVIMGAAISLATITAAIDHTRHRLPEAQELSEQINFDLDTGFDGSASPCSLDIDPDIDNRSPCSLGD